MSAYWSDAHDEIKYPFATGCIADQILGQWHAEVAGLGLFLSPGKVRTALASVHAENFRPSLADQVNRCRNYAFEAEGGLLIATYPSGTRQQVVAAAPCAEEVWSGVDYASASLMIMQGLVEEGLTVVRAVRGRHDDARCEHLMPSARGMAMVFPSYTLYSHMNVEENLRFGLENQKLAKSEIAAQVQKAADILQISLLLKRRPHQLTGGQSQRVAIGRAIVKEPKAFLFDEPLSNLDAELREKMRGELVALHQRLGSAMVYVTHDQVKAMTMADQITVSRDGRVEQAG